MRKLDEIRKQLEENNHNLVQKNEQMAKSLTQFHTDNVGLQQKLTDHQQTIDTLNYDYSQLKSSLNALQNEKEHVMRLLKTESTSNNMQGDKGRDIVQQVEFLLSMNRRLREQCQSLGTQMRDMTEEAKYLQDFNHQFDEIKKLLVSTQKQFQQTIGQRQSGDKEDNNGKTFDPSNLLLHNNVFGATKEGQQELLNKSIQRVDKLLDSRKNLFKNQVGRLSREKVDLTKQMATLQSEYDQLHYQMSIQAQEFKNLHSAHAQLSHELKVVEQERQKLSQKFALHEQLNAEYKSTLLERDFLFQKAKALEQEMESLKKLQQLGRSDRNEKTGTSEQQIRDLNEDYDKLKSEVSELSQLNDVLSDQLKTLTTTHSEMNKQLDNLFLANQLLHQQVSMLSNEKTTLRDEAQQKENELKKHKQQCQQHVSELQQ
ncbi:hypothetical protein RFI_39922, partial [Reticulomyxa filosa]